MDGAITTDEALQRYAALFVNRWDRYMSLALAGHWICRKQRLTSDYLAAALSGRSAEPR